MDDYEYSEMKLYSSRSRTERSYNKDTTYRDYVDVLCARNPCLLNLLSFLSSPRGSRRKCRMTALDFRDGLSHPISRHVPDLDDLSYEMRGNLRPGGEVAQELERDHRIQGRLLIVEDLTDEIVELLGSSLDIDPLFFALHLHTTQRNDMRSQTPDEATLPSRLTSQDFINTTYHRPLVCDKGPPHSREKLVRDMTIDRKLVFIRSTSIGLAQHCVSILKVRQSDDFWIAVLLADPPITDTYYPSSRKGKEVRLELRPFLGMYEDFLDPPKYSDEWAHLDECPRGGMASEVVQYFERSMPSCFDPKDPTLQSLAYFPLRIVAGEWVKYVAVMQHCIKMYEYQGDKLPHLEQFNTDLRELQGWRRRSMVSQAKARSVIRQLKSRHSPEPHRRSDLDFLIEDFETISINIKNAGKRLENMLPVVTSLVQIIDARQSFAETTNISRLTILALIFVPLNFVSSLFSMNDVNGPGGRAFWVYFAVAIPITLLVYVIARPPTELIMKGWNWLRTPRRRSLPVPRLSPKTAEKDSSKA